MADHDETYSRMVSKSKKDQQKGEKIMNQANWTVIQAKIHWNTTMRFKPKINTVCSLQIQARKW